MRWRITGVAVAAMVAIGPAGAQVPATPPGYLNPPPDVFQTLTPAPAKGDPRDEADRRVFRETRALAGSPRWALATEDDTAHPLKVFACALGAEIAPDKTPKLITMMRRIGRDGGGLSGPAKEHYARRRPFLEQKGPTCIPPTDPSLKGYDYPSGHATNGWMFGSLLAALAPDRATAIMARARAYGESRYICGVHNLSAVEAGRMTASIVMAAEAGSSEYRRDLEDVRAELTAARNAAPKPDPARCAREAEMTASPVLGPKGP